MSAYWINFVKTGNPNGDGLPEWKPFSRTEGSVMEFGEQPLLNPGLYKKEIDFIESAHKQ